MICNVFKPKRKTDGKKSQQRMYRGRYRLDGDSKLTDVPLHTFDKQVAVERLKKIVREKQQQREGLIASKPQREAAQKPLAEHLEDFIRSRQSIGRDEKYVKELRKKVLKLVEDCGWELPCHVTAESFEAWRNGQEKSAKTLNEYLTAAFTGLRRGELLKLEWRDLHLEAVRPFVNVRASISKNHKQAMLPLHSDLVNALRRYQTAGASETALVFKGIVPRMHIFREDLAAAEIAYVDGKGEFADFHSLRKTFATMLTLAGVPQRVIMELMRHSDMRLTAKTYTDAGMLPTDSNIALLPSINSAPQLAPQSLVQARPALSLVVRETEAPKFAGARMNTGFERDLALPVNECPAMSESEEWCAMQGSNLRANAVFIRVRGRLTHKYTHKVSATTRNLLKSWGRGPICQRRSRRLSWASCARSVPRAAWAPLPSSGRGLDSKLGPLARRANEPGGIVARSAPGPAADRRRVPRRPCGHGRLRGQNDRGKDRLRESHPPGRVSGQRESRPGDVLSAVAGERGDS
jgi:integrase